MTKVKLCPEEALDFSLNELPLKSKFKALLFYGTADGTFLSKAFDEDDLKKRIIVIKSFRIIPYADTAFVDLYVNDGATTSKETIPAKSRINRIFDFYNLGARINFLLNGAPLTFFQSVDSAGVAVDGYPVDLWIDNIYYKYPAKVSAIDLAITAKVFDDIEAGTTVNPLVKVIVECYLI